MLQGINSILVPTGVAPPSPAVDPATSMPPPISDAIPTLNSTRSQLPLVKSPPPSDYLTPAPPAPSYTDTHSSPPVITVDKSPPSGDINQGTSPPGEDGNRDSNQVESPPVGDSNQVALSSSGSTRSEMRWGHASGSIAVCLLAFATSALVMPFTFTV